MLDIQLRTLKCLYSKNISILGVKMRIVGTTYCCAQCSGAIPGGAPGNIHGAEMEPVPPADKTCASA